MLYHRGNWESFEKWQVWGAEVWLWGVYPKCSLLQHFLSRADLISLDFSEASDVLGKETKKKEEKIKKKEKSRFNNVKSLF